MNGFDERMQYGGQDREFGERLENYGIHGMQIRYSTVCLHLDHARGYKTKDSIQKNRNIRKHTRGAKVQWASLGIVKDELRGQSVKVNSYYDRYIREEEKLTSYKEKEDFTDISILCLAGGEEQSIMIKWCVLISRTLMLRHYRTIRESLSR